ncbi:hypothetical protein ART_2977 [Arthrobacter sp. PAMC 25486]|nr:hypothetical protein ART_2977 [Arthrobacter sp. PAMC 25486]
MLCTPAETSQRETSQRENSQGQDGLNADSRDGGSQAESPTKEHKSHIFPAVWRGAI